MLLFSSVKRFDTVFTFYTIQRKQWKQCLTVYSDLHLVFFWDSSSGWNTLCGVQHSDIFDTKSTHHGTSTVLQQTLACRILWLRLLRILFYLDPMLLLFMWFDYIFGCFMQLWWARSPFLHEEMSHLKGIYNGSVSNDFSPSHYCVALSSRSAVVNYVHVNYFQMLLKPNSQKINLCSYFE